MGIGDFRISTSAIILIGLFMLFFPLQNVDGILSLSLDLTEEEIKESYKREQRIKAEKIRDEIFNSLKISNPYLSNLEIQISFEENEDNIPKVITRHYEKFQKIKDEQITLAEKKCNEILGGKSITNDFDVIIFPKASITIQIDNQTGFMNRNYEEFINYKLLQTSIVEDYRDNYWKLHHWNSNPYENYEEHIDDVNYDKIKILEGPTSNTRNSVEFKKLIIEQVMLAENIRNEMLEVTITGLTNPYIEKESENIDTNLNQTFNELQDKSVNKISINWLEPTYMLEKPEFNVLDRDSNEFEMIKTMEHEIAKNKLNQLLKFSNIIEEDSNEVSDEKILQIIYKKPINYERNDQGFEFFKNLEEDKAEKKLREILGNKVIHSIDYLKYEKIKLKSYSNTN